ncbi:MAG: hypothetical protein LIR50_19400 [Bacillota bacterium]|nr:hypothetical protein [Bacillota bacterium]
MKVARIALEDILNELLNKYSLNNNISKTAQSYYINKNLSPSKIMKILNKEDPLTMVNERELYYLCRILATSINSNNQPVLTEDELSRVNVEKYFNPKEIQLSDNFKGNPENRNKSIFTIKDVKRINNKVFMAIMTYNDIIDFMDDGWITYNYETQREATISTKRRKNGISIIKKPTINQEAIAEIEELIKLNKFTPNLITFNITDYSGIGTEGKGFSVNGSNLVIERGTEIAIIDGFHRIIATARAKEHAIDPDAINGLWYVNILNFTIDDAQDYIFREDKHTPIDKKHTATYNKNDAAMDVTTKLNTDGGLKTNAMFGRVTTNMTEIKYGDKYTTFDIMANSIRNSFDLKKPMDIAFASDILKEGFNYIIGLQQENFDSRNNSIDLSTHYNMFAFYVVLIANLKNESNLMQSIKYILNLVDFSMENEFWKELGLLNLKVNKSTINKIQKYCKKLLVDLEVEA